MTTTAPSAKTTPDTEKPAADFVRLFKLTPQARLLLRDQHRLLGYLDLLMTNRLYEDGVRLLAHALPKREAVWWACQCARSTAGDQPAPDFEAAVRAAEQWVVDPNDGNRRAARQAAKQTGYGTPAGCAGLAAFFSGGSLGPANLPAIPPDPLQTAQFVVNAVLLAGVASEPGKAPQRYDQFLRQGIQLMLNMMKSPQRRDARRQGE
jgi:hypothetical protein